jgi:hypothetical protein
LYQPPIKTEHEEVNVRDLDKVLLRFSKFRETYIHSPNVEQLKFSTYRKNLKEDDQEDQAEQWDVIDANSFMTYTLITDSNYEFINVDANLNDYAKGHTPKQLHHWSNMDFTVKESNKKAMAEVCRQVYRGHTHLLRRSLYGGQKMLVTIAVMDRKGSFEDSTFVTTILMEEAWKAILSLSEHHDEQDGSKRDAKRSESIKELFSSNSNFI